jgi:hypothetical protein
MSSTTNHAAPVPVPIPVKAPEPAPEQAPVQVSMIRDEEAAKKCCSIVKSDVHICFKCCTYTWACSLNGIECCCGGLSTLCLMMSRCALGCRDCLEKIDCDGRK